MELSEEEKKAIETLEIEGTENNYLEVKILLNLVEKQQNLINVFIHNEAVREGKDFKEIKEKYYDRNSSKR